MRGILNAQRHQGGSSDAGGWTKTLLTLVLTAGMTGMVLGENLPEPGIRVHAVQGHAEVAQDASGMQVRLAVPAMDLADGNVIRMKPGSALDIHFGTPKQRLRLTENSQLILKSIAPDEVHLQLTKGQVIGIGTPAEKPSQFRITIPGGMVAVQSGHYRIDARGYLVALEGTLIFAWSNDTGKVTSEIVKGPPASFYAPGHGSAEAPPQLVNEIAAQTHATITPSGPGRVATPLPRTVPRTRDNPAAQPPPSTTQKTSPFSIKEIERYKIRRR